MFAKTPIKKSCPLTHEQIIADVEIISNIPEHRDKLFTCIDDKIPERRKCDAMEIIQRDNERLNQSLQELNKEAEDLKMLSANIEKKVEELKEKVNT